MSKPWYQKTFLWGQVNLTENDPKECDLDFWRDYWKKSGVEGVIIKEDQARGINKALAKMCDYAQKNIKDPEEKIAVVAHCNNRERAELVKEELLKRVPFRDVVITETAGVATVYASDGGVILAC